MKFIGDFLIYLIYRVVETLARALPMKWCWQLGALFGSICSWVMLGYRGLVQRNMRIAFGGEMGNDTLRKMARLHLRTLGGNLLTSFKMPWLSSREVEDCLTIDGIHHATAAVSAGNGFIYGLMHMGNWEILSHAGIMAPGTKPAAMFQPLSNRWLNAHVLHCRERTGCRLFDRHDGFNQPVRWLRENGALGILLDQHAGDGGVWCPFFGRLASTTNLACLLSKRTGAPILPVTISTTAPGQWQVTIDPPLESYQSINKATAALNGALEKNVRRSPKDWFWEHNRWKTPNPDFLLAKYRRGITLPEGMIEKELQPFSMIIRSPNWLGDACMAVPAVRALKRGRPDAHVTMLCPEKIAAIWSLIPEVDEVIAVPEKCGVWGTSRLLREAGPFDVGILFPNSLRSALEMWRAGVPRIVGYKGHSRKWLLHQIIEGKKKPGPILHHTRHYLRIALRLGANVEDPTLHNPVARVFPARVRPMGAPVRLGLCAGAEYGPAKRWPIERFAEAARQVAAKVRCEWVLFGSSSETAMAEELVALILPTKCKNLVGKTSLEELFTQLQSCHLLLTNDTGTMHVANLLGVPVVAIFGSTEPAWTGPSGPNDWVFRRHVECSPCFLRECPLDFRCMREIEPEVVAATVLQECLAPSNA